MLPIIPRGRTWALKGDKRVGKTVVLASALAAVCVSAAENLTTFADPFVGTDGTGHTFPGACRPMGLVQASPDTGTETWDYCSGYRHGDKEIRGFSHTHLNGTGGRDLGDILILPFVGDVTVNHKEPIDKATEVASPGYYAVILSRPGIRAEVTVSEHAAIYRFDYGQCQNARLLVDGQWGIVNPGCTNRYVIDGQFSVEGACGISGKRKTRNWNEREMGFVVEFSHPFARCSQLPKWGEGEKGERYVLDFDLSHHAPLLVKVGLSRTSAERAKLNLSKEIPDWDFDAVREAARKAWERLFASARIEGSGEQKRNWYTSLYHLYIQPNNIADVDEKPFYSTFSCWDTFRAAGPLYTILTPDKVAEFVDSMLEQGKKTGYLPIWTLWGSDNQCMIGTHSVPMIVDAYLKGIWAGDAETAYRQIWETLTKKHKRRIKENWDIYDKYGYYPFDLIKGESVSRTMECAYDDWCAAQMATKLGKDGDAAFFMKRAGYWKNVFDPSIGMVRGKDSVGKWREPFNPYALGHGADLANDFTEGNAFQYTWHVMQDPQGLIAAMGGREKFAAKLDALFTAPDKVDGAGCVVDVTGLVGQYVHGNEPSHHVLYFYPQIGHPEKAAERIREVFDRFYLTKPDGLCGNDDCGQMSAWYLFSAMGFYPFNPCGGEYVIGAPQVPKVTLNLANGKTFTMTAKNLSMENKYVQSVILNGKPVSGFVLKHADVMAGGELVFEMTAERK